MSLPLFDDDDEGEGEEAGYGRQHEEIGHGKQREESGHRSTLVVRPSDIGEVD